MQDAHSRSVRAWCVAGCSLAAASVLYFTAVPQELRSNRLDVPAGMLTIMGLAACFGRAARLQEMQKQAFNCKNAPTP